MAVTRLESIQPLGGRAAEAVSLVEAVGLGVRFTLGSRREDVQSLTYRALLNRKKHEEFWALKDVSFTGGAGDIVGIIGANGAGKTTLCRVLAGLLRPDAGTLTVKGETSALLVLGTGFNTQLSGRENIFLNGLMLGLSKREITALLPQIVDFSGLGRFIDEPLKHYSSGMKSRLGFSIAAMVEPEILILDETLRVGDLEFTVKAGEKLQALIGKAKMVMVATHSLDFVETYCTRALWLDRGTVQATGRPDQVVPRYREAIPKPDPARNTPELRRNTPQSRSPQVVVASHVAVKFFLRETKHHGEEKIRHIPAFWKGRQRPFWALNDISFTVNEGEIVGVIGPNGAGKTTLCKVLTGILKPDEGQVSVAGEITALLTVGAGFNHQLTGQDNIYLNGMMLGMPKRRVRDVYPRIVAFSGLGRFIEEPVKCYSGGMRSRLGFSIAAMLEPDVLIIDEALNAGDAAFYEKAAARIQEIMTRAKAVIVVTHNLAFVESVCTRTLWLHEGRILFDGIPGEAVAYYRHASQATTTGSSTPAKGGHRAEA